uniref:SGNH hydrolase-type esterase domain-containing protein n=1 Tax=Oncorhynchus tshawytscha TaxID=74940 RepID=A0AAZ3QP05_ONCTS
MGVLPSGRLSSVDWPLLGSDRSLKENGDGGTFVAESRDDPLLDLTGRHVAVHRRNQGGSRVGLSAPARNGQHPSTIIMESSMVRSVEVRSTRTLCFPGAKVLDISEVMPTIKKQILAPKIVVLDIGSNDIMQPKIVSSQFHLLVVVGCFSHLWSFHKWLMRLTKDLGMFFVFNLDSFWNRPGFFLEDGIHLGENGTRLLSSNVGNVLGQLN